MNLLKKMEQGAGVLAHCDLPVDPAGQWDRLGRRVFEMKIVEGHLYGRIIGHFAEW